VGLDQWAYVVQHGKGVFSRKIEIGRWRKHQALDNFMSDLFEDLSPDHDTTFNLTPCELSIDALADLESHMGTSNFYQCIYNPDEQRVYDLEFIHKARFYLIKGDAVYYKNYW